jgi:hypothetical protein
MARHDWSGDEVVDKGTRPAQTEGVNLGFGKGYGEFIGTEK